MEINFNEPVEISSDTYWVGKKSGDLLERNIYLRVFKQSNKSINLVIDPGPPSDLSALTEKTGKIIGSIKNIDLIFVNHQDPDVSYNSATIQKLNPNALVLASEDTFRLINFYGINTKKTRAVESFKDMEITLSTGHKIKFVPSPFCHFRGAVMLYDPETRILFSGDLFGGLSFTPSLFADENYLEGIKTFHQIYMPTKDALKFAINNIKSLDPPPLFIAPQHGLIIGSEKLKEAISFLENLDVGLDLYLKRKDKENYIAGMNEILEYGKSLLDKKNIEEILKGFKDLTFTSIFSFDSSGIKDIKVDPEYALEFLLNNFEILLPEDKVDFFETEVIRILLIWNIPLPKHFDKIEREEINLFEGV